MGYYDSVNVPCPICGTKTWFQSKSGPCNLDYWELDEAPADVLMDVNRHAPYKCDKCGTLFQVEVRFITLAKSVVYQPEDDDSD